MNEIIGLYEVTIKLLFFSVIVAFVIFLIHCILNGTKDNNFFPKNTANDKNIIIKILTLFSIISNKDDTAD